MAFDINDLWTILLGGGSGLSASLLVKTILTERIKKSIEAEYNTKLESHKGNVKIEVDAKIEQIKSNNSIELERQKSALAIAAAERQLVFGRLHERRLEAIAETYARLLEIVEQIRDVHQDKLLVPGVPAVKPEIPDRIHNGLREFEVLLRRNRIYLPESTQKIAVELTKKLHAAVTVIDDVCFDSSAAQIVPISDLVRHVSHEVDPLLDALVQDFRSHIEGKKLVAN